MTRGGVRKLRFGLALAGYAVLNVVILVLDSLTAQVAIDDHGQSIVNKIQFARMYAWFGGLPLRCIAGVTVEEIVVILLE